MADNIDFSNNGAPRFEVLGPVTKDVGVEIVITEAVVIDVFFFLFVFVLYVLLSEVVVCGDVGGPRVAGIVYYLF